MCPQTPDDLLFAVAHMLGFWPDDSVAVVMIEDAAIAGVVRVDIEGFLPLEVDQLLQPATIRLRHPPVVLVGYGERTRVDACLRELSMLFAPERILDTIATDWNTWWCGAGGPFPMPDELPPLDRVGRASGGAMLASRSEISARVRRPDGLRQQQLAEEVARQFEAGPIPAGDAVEATRRLVRDALSSDTLPGTPELVHLSLLLEDPDCRDAAWTTITHEDAARSLDLWLAVAGASIDLFAPAPLCMAATAAWVLQQWVLMGECVHQALEINPAYSLAGLLETVCLTGTPPDAWQRVLAGLPERD